MSQFKLTSPYQPAGDQPAAIEKLIANYQAAGQEQTLLGATGTGKTFTIANLIQAVGKPTLVIVHNKTLAAQLAQEYKEFFPENAVHYFVSYYDYYQPEAYVAASDTYIEKEAQINEEIDRLRHASTQALLTRKDVIIVASVSCIYGLGSPEEYEAQHLKIERGLTVTRGDFIRQLIEVHFTRTTADLSPGQFRALGNAIEIMPVNERVIYRVQFSGTTIGDMQTIDAITREVITQPEYIFLFPAKHFVTERNQLERITGEIEAELEARLKELDEAGKILERERLSRRTKQDLALIREIGYCTGIENYSRFFDGRKPGEAPNTLLSFFPHLPDGTPDFLTVIDESHVTVPQIGGMSGGDRARKASLIEHGFRLPSAADNRPLTFGEFAERIGEVVYVSATPSSYEREQSTEAHGVAGIVEQIIRPTGLVDPKLEIKPVTSQGDTYPGQIKDFIAEAEAVVRKGQRVIATTLTKQMAEDLSEYLKERGLRAEYLHSDIKTIERIEILTKLRKGEFDVLVGVNLLREGLDLPEVSLIGIFDADKEGFLRSETSLIQIIGRAARNVDGRVILYADKMTKALSAAVDETNRRRAIQLEFNEKNGITPQTIQKKIHDITEELRKEHERAVKELLRIDTAGGSKTPKALIKEKQRLMNEAVKNLDFETAAIIRDEIYELQKLVDKK